MNIGQELFEAAKTLIDKRYPSGEGGAAALRRLRFDHFQ